MLASAVIKVAIEHLNSTILGEIKLHRNMRNDMENMKMTLESVDAVLRDAERESIKHRSMLLWLKQLKDAANDISHMLEDFEDETDLNLMFQLPKDGCCSATRLAIEL
uniref:Disease resistance N-terminal domain-containing protein n=1 Tax=Triticum aestivum TaxID=4565 RepID=A0A3B6C1F4_WHEAT